MADALGIDTKKLFAIAFSIGAGLAAVAGVLLAPLTAVIAQMGVNYLARSFFVVIVGGAGSVPGVVAGSALVGGIETLFNYVIPATLRPGGTPGTCDCHRTVSAAWIGFRMMS